MSRRKPRQGEPQREEFSDAPNAFSAQTDFISLEKSMFRNPSRPERGGWSVPDSDSVSVMTIDAERVDNDDDYEEEEVEDDDDLSQSQAVLQEYKDLMYGKKKLVAPKPFTLNDTVDAPIKVSKEDLYTSKQRWFAPAISKEGITNAVISQRAHLANLHSSDFVDSIGSIIAKDSTKKKKKGQNTSAEDNSLPATNQANQVDSSKEEPQLGTSELDKMSPEERRKFVSRKSPELQSLLADYQQCVEQMLTLQALVEKANGLPRKTRSQAWVQFMQIKFALLKQYCMNVSFFFSLKMADLTLRDHPVIDQMVAGKESLNKLKAVEEKFRTRIDKFAMSDENDILEMTEEKKIPKSKSSVKPEPTSTPKEKAKKSAKTIDISTKPTTSSTKKIVINHTPTTSTKTSTKTEPASTDSAKSTTTTSKVVKKPFEPKPTKKPANTPKTTKSLASPKQMKPSTGKSIFTVTKPQTTPTSPPPKAEPSEIQTTSTSPLPPPANNKPVRATAFDLDDIIEDLDDEEVDYQKAESSQKNYAGMSYAVSALEQTSAAPQRSADVDIPLPLDKKMKSIKRVKEEAKKTKETETEEPSEAEAKPKKEKEPKKTEEDEAEDSDSKRPISLTMEKNKVLQTSRNHKPKTPHTRLRKKIDKKMAKYNRRKKVDKTKVYAGEAKLSKRVVRSWKFS